MNFTKYLTIILAGGLLTTSCGDDFFDDKDSSYLTPDQISEESSKDPDKILSSQLKGCYTNWNEYNPASSYESIVAHQEKGFGGLMTLYDVMSNDVSLALGSGDPWYYDHTLDYNSERYVRPAWPWQFYYTVIKSANDLINVVPEDESTSEAQRQYLGQAYAFRGYAFFSLAQHYQKTYVDSKNLACVPIQLSGKETSIRSRATVEQVYTQAVSDLTKAIDYLDGYTRTDKQEIDKQVAQGFLARVYLVMNEWSKAAEMANAARQGYAINDIETAETWNYQDVDNSEVLWGFTPTESNKMYYASWASWHSTDGPGYGGTQVGALQLIDAALYDKMSSRDVRRYLFVDPEDDSEDTPAYMNLKFKFVSQWLGNVVYMRSSEMLLIEAEGKLMSGDQAGAVSLMNEFMKNRVQRWRDVTSITQEDIYTQRRLELWGEGFAYFDCLRLKQDLVRNYEGTNEPISSQANVPASSYKWIYQIPLSELNDNDEITEEDQNPLQ